MQKQNDQHRSFGAPMWLTVTAEHRVPGVHTDFWFGQGPGAAISRSSKSINLSPAAGRRAQLRYALYLRGHSEVQALGCSQQPFVVAALFTLQALGSPESSCWPLGMPLRARFLSAITNLETLVWFITAVETRLQLMD